MHADTGFPLTLAHVRSAPVSLLLAGVKSWLARENPVCLMHPHGFYVALLHCTEAEEWRFHMWPKGTRNVLGMPAFIHTHDRNLESRVLEGELTNILYDVREVTLGGRPLYTVEYGGDRYKSSTSNLLKRTDSRVETTIRCRETIRPGGMYCVEHHIFHEVVVPESRTTTTIVCMNRRSPGAVNVVGIDGYRAMISFARTERRAEHFLALIEE